MLWRMYKFMVGRPMQGLIKGSRIALGMWLGVRDKKWSFLLPPGLLRDKGKLPKSCGASWFQMWRV